MYNLISKHFGVELARGKQTISAVNLSSDIAKILGVAVNSAAIFAEYITYDEKSMPLELLHSYYRVDKYSLEIELGRYHAKPNGVSMKAE